MPIHAQDQARKSISYFQHIAPKEQIKQGTVLFPDAIVDPDAVVIEGSDAEIAVIAMLHPEELVLLADRAKFCLNRSLFRSLDLTAGLLDRVTKVY